MEQTDQPIGFADLKPSRDLWPGIEAELESRRVVRRPWMGRAAGIAASLVLALGVVIVADRDVRESPLSGEAVAQQVEPSEPTSGYLGHDGFVMALASLEGAEAQLQAALRADAANPRMLRLLARVRHQRTELIVKDAKQRSLS